jgi:hypothetical protein
MIDGLGAMWKKAVAATHKHFTLYSTILLQYVTIYLFY